MRPVLLALLSATLLFGCSGRPAPELLRPLAIDPPADARVTMVRAVTTRVPTEDQPWVYGTTRAAEPQYARFAVSIPPAHQSGRIEWPDSIAKADPARHFVTRGQARMDRQTFLSEIRNESVGLYVHGFNTSFQESVYRLAQLSTDSHLDGMPIVFSWPSHGHVAAYLADRDGSDFSRSALAALLSDVTAGRSPSRPVVVLGHSMGGRLTMEALRQLKLAGRTDVLDRIEVVLAAPDIDTDLFREQMAIIGTMRHPITVLVSSDDGALKASARLASRRSRLGQLDVHSPEVQALAVQTDIRIIDITSLPATDTAHSRYVGLLTDPGTRDTNPFQELRGAGAFIFDQVGTTITAIGTAIGD